MNLFQRYEEILRRLVTELKALYGARLVACAVYGSVGRGTPRQDSDVDLLIVARDLPRGRLDRVEEFLAEEANLEPLLQRSEEHTSELQSLAYLVCRLLLEKKKRMTSATMQ